ncbi:hypothetical protein [Schaalia hyovaginalis]|uniref:hypothetical protein n=1 Tax=Schaalia hyovaginalis TaxID=29316 RepID=UPI001F234CE1|nr:hypothetical protein [Schaalia hyovaginalis]MCF2711449.1 hypothetical protein [Schaalia hyovaginalis]
MPGHDFKRPRRPAMLGPATAEAIIGDEDPAASSALAHSSAWALMGVGDEDFDIEAIGRLRALVRGSGVDAIAHLWARSPEFTLPGALWRLYLLVEWCERDRALACALYDAGTRARIVPGLERPLEVRPLESILDEAEALLRGDLSDDELDHVLVQASIALRLLAAGEGGNGDWITDPNDPLAHAVTTRARAFLATAEELDIAAREARVGALD